jgi:hypothetical protein
MNFGCGQILLAIAFRTEKTRIQNSVELVIETISLIGSSDVFPLPQMVILQTPLLASISYIPSVFSNL